MESKVNKHKVCIVVTGGSNSSSNAFRVLCEIQNRIATPRIVEHGLERIQHREMKKAQLKLRMTSHFP